MSRPSQPPTRNTKVDSRKNRGDTSTDSGPLDQTSILLAAIELIELDGLHQLSMRRLGAHLGVEAMALYRYVRSRDDLLDGIVNKLIEDLNDDPDVVAQTNNWREYVHRWAHAIRRLALRYPQTFPLISTRSPVAPWLRPPLRSLQWADTFLGTVRAAGFTDRSAAEAYRAFASFLLGYLLLEVSGRGADTAPVPQVAPGAPGASTTDLSRYPNLVELQGELSDDHTSEEFEEALDALVDRLEGTMHRQR